MASIEKRGENSYRITVTNGTDSTGKKDKKRKSITLDPRMTPKQIEKELQRQAALFEEEVKRGTYLDAGKITFKEFIDRWLTDYAEKQLEPKTLHCYKIMLNNRIIPALGYLKLDKIQPNHLIEFYNNLAEPGIRQDGKGDTLSESTIQKYHRIISSILQDAMQWQLIFSNPASRVKPPKVRKKEAGTFDEEKTALLLETLESEQLKYKVLVLLGTVTGLRRGELVALKWENVDLKNCIIDVKYSAQYVPGKGVSIKEPKTKSSFRKIAISSSVKDLLKSYKQIQSQERLESGDQWKGDDWVFTQLNGEIMHPDTPTKWFKKFLEVHNEKVHSDKNIPKNQKEKYLLPVIKFHCLRHTAATLLIHKGLNVRAVSSRLGHANTSTTMNIYAHALQTADKQAADMMESILTPKKKVSKKA